jgi:hypothetical protein
MPVLHGKACRAMIRRMNRASCRTRLLVGEALSKDERIADADHPVDATRGFERILAVAA